MALRLPRLPRAVAIVGKEGWPAQKFQQWWQSVSVAIEGAIATLDAAVTDITDILVRLGLVEVTADGALDLAESAINPDGTIKTDKVLTDSLTVGAVTERYLSQRSTSIALPDGVETDVVNVSVTKIEASSDIDIDIALRLESSDDIRGAINLYRDATLVDSFGPFMSGLGGTFRVIIPMTITDIGVAAGTYDYQVTFERTGGASAITAGAGTLIRAKEFKR